MPRLPAGSFARAIQNPNECLIEIEQRYWDSLNDPERCTVILHESGHLRFKRHTTKGIMRPSFGPRPDYRCMPKRLRKEFARRA